MALKDEKLSFERGPTRSTPRDRIARLQWPSLLVTLVVIFTLGLTNPFFQPPTVLVLSGVLVILAIVPFWFWMGSADRSPIPLLELHCIFYATSFGFAGFVYKPISMLLKARRIGANDLVQAQYATLLALLCLFFGYYVIGKFSRAGERRKWIPRWDINTENIGWVIYVLFPLLSLLQIFSRKNTDLNLTQVSNSIVQFLTIFLVALFLSGRMKKSLRPAFIILVVPYIVVFEAGLATGQLAMLVKFSCMYCLAFAAFRQRAPLRLIAFAVLVVLLLQPVKGEFRQIAWKTDHNMSALERTKLFLELGTEYYRKPEALAAGFSEAYSRVNHLHVTATVIADTPERLPFRYGATYSPIFTKWIPRALWPDKPIENLGNRWALDYGYLHYDDDETSFNLPWLPEAFINFGWYGIALLNIPLGFLFRILNRGLFNSPSLTQFALGLQLAMGLVFVESNFSLQVGGVLINYIIITGLLWVASTLTPNFVLRNRV